VTKGERWGAVLTLGVLALLLLCQFGPCRPRSLKERLAWSNRMDEVVGRVQLIVPAEREADYAVLSPGGEWLLVMFHREWAVFDLVRGVEYPRRLKCPDTSEVRWVDRNRFILGSGFSDCYYLVEMPGMEVRKLAEVEEDPVRLARAPWPVYVTKSLGIGGFTAFSLGEEPFAMPLEGPATDPPAWVKAIPHIRVPRSRSFTGRQRGFSHGGRCYATASLGAQIRLAENNALLARAFKPGWNHRILGWAHDDSGVYFQLGVEGEVAAIHYPWVTVWKLELPEGVSCRASESLNH